VTDISSAPLKTSSVAAEGDTDSDTDIEESSDLESLATESSLAEVQNEKDMPMLIDTSDNEDEKEEKESLPSTTTQKPTIRRDSSIRSALEFAKDHQDSGIGLLKYFSQGTKEDVDVYWKNEEERTAVDKEKQNFKKKSVEMDKKQHARELARVRQQRWRDRIKEKEIKKGVRSPGGKKRKVNQNISTKTKLITRARSLS
jgi:hypothetical protein